MRHTFAERVATHEDKDDLMRSWIPLETPARTRAVAAGVAGLALVALGSVLGAGSWYADDLDFLVHGSRGFGAGELMAPVNDHVAPGLRLTYALLASDGLPSYRVTVVVRLLAWLVVMALTAGLVLRVTRRAWTVPLAVALVGFSTLAMPSTASLSSAVNNLPAHVFTLVALHATLDWFEGRAWHRLAVVALGVLAAMAYWELSALVVLTAAGVVAHEHGIAALVRRRGLAWCATVATTGAAFAAFYLLATSSEGGRWPGVAPMATLIGKAAGRVVLPAFTGGPWTWSAVPPSWFGLASPGVVVQVVGALMAAALLAATLRWRPRAGWLWLTLALQVLVTVVLVAIGRYAGFGDVLTRHHHYWSALTVPFVLVVVGGVVALADSGARWARPAVVLLAAAWVAGTTASWVTFAVPWSRNPSGTYLANLRTEAGAVPDVNLWDTRPPLEVMPYVSNNASVVELARLTGLDPQSMAGTSEPFLVDDAGHLRTAELNDWGHVPLPANCRRTVNGARETRLPITEDVPSGDWFVRVGYLARADAEVEVRLAGAGGSVGTGGRRVWPGGLGRQNLRADATVEPHTVVIRTFSKDAGVCLGDITVGQPRATP